MKRPTCMGIATFCIGWMLLGTAAAQDAKQEEASADVAAKPGEPAADPAPGEEPPAAPQVAAAPDGPAAPVSAAGVETVDVPDPERFAPDGWNTKVLDAVLRANRTLEATTFKEFYDKYKSETLWIAHWCHAKLTLLDASQQKPDSLEPESDEVQVCKAAVAAASVTNGNEQRWTGKIENAEGLDAISIFQLAAVARAFNPPNCAGFGLIVPLYSVRLSRGGGTEARGPVDAGLGGGYYWGNVVCKPTFSTGPEVFGYSEGLDPSGEFHLGVGAGWQLTAYKYFQFGIAVGYDLYRRVPVADAAEGADDAQTNGIFAFEDMGPRPSMSFLFTFSITGGTPSETDEEE